LAFPGEPALRKYLQQETARTYGPQEMMGSQLADNVAGKTIHEDAFAWSQRTINTKHNRGGSGGSGKIVVEVQCLVPLDALRLVPWIVVVSFLPTPLDTHLHQLDFLLLLS
jgi:hypothetical protein